MGLLGLDALATYGKPGALHTLLFVTEVWLLTLGLWHNLLLLYILLVLPTRIYLSVLSNTWDHTQKLLKVIRLKLARWHRRVQCSKVVDELLSDVHLLLILLLLKIQKLLLKLLMVNLTLLVLIDFCWILRVLVIEIQLQLRRIQLV